MATKEHLEKALDEAENTVVKFHIRQALQLQIIEEECSQFTDHCQPVDLRRQ